MHHFFKNNRVNILSQHIQKKPIAHFGFLDYNIDAFFLDESIPNVKQVGSHSRRENYEETINDNKKRQRQKEK